MTKEVTQGYVSRTASGERLGLALSGGGFRASFFHIGVLARMADLGLLRHVEVISTVSGGSIIGALYYLNVKRLLEDKADGEILDEDYRAIVARIETEFLRGVQKNLIIHTFLNPFTNIRMSLANYSRSDRLGELYDHYFYRPVMAPGRSDPVEMRGLKIRPKEEKDGFNPTAGNQGRSAKVPIILINATTLNTGHNWRFEASRMGEPPSADAVAMEIDKNLRLRRASYGDIVRKQQNIELGHAVAASACVPGIFPPLAISGLYPDGIRVQLVDGGVYDNQGVQGLLDTDCNCFVVSDASGQLGDEPDPATNIPAVLSRSNSILMDRVREEEMLHLLGGNDPPAAFMHLRKGLTAEAFPCLGPDGKPAQERKTERASASSSKSFGVSEEVQDLLSHVRTHLDSFTDVEACSLMLDGYLMSEGELRTARGIRNLITNPSSSRVPTWQFNSIAPWMLTPTQQYLRQLSVAGELALKIFRLSLPTTILTGLAGLAILIAAWFFGGSWLREQLSRSVTIGDLLVAVFVLALGLIPRMSRTFKAFRFIRAPSEFLLDFVRRLSLSFFISLIMAVHIALYDRLFLWQGKISRLRPPPGP